jgi:uncharacterized membrane protein
MDFQYPELLLLAIPVGYLYYRFGRVKGITGALRVVILLLLILTIAGPRWNLSGTGIDVMIVADHSRSMPDNSSERVKELIHIVEKNRGSGDRVGLVSMGAEPQLEYIPRKQGLLTEFKSDTNVDGSDLNAAIETALNANDNQFRPVRVLVLSDGEYTGPSPALAARRAREANIKIDYRKFERVREGDYSIESLMLPEVVSPREPFQFTVNVYCSLPAKGTLTIERAGKVIAKSERDFKIGYQQFPFRDLIDQPGLYQYQAKLEVTNDPLIENNIGIGMMRVEAEGKVLLLNRDGQAGNLGQELKTNGFNVDVKVASTFPMTLDALDPYRVVILEDVPAREFGRQKMQTLAQFIEELGGGFLMTGGKNSFGAGGYFKSPLEELLPVSMEMRKEHRKSSIAIAIALDRSGSMMAPVGDHQTKMDLANIGTAECIRLLSSGDSVAVIAVDSAPHVVQYLTEVDDPERIAKEVLKIESTGGGIFVYEALLAAGKELAKADQATKHIILFSDAADSEEPGDYKTLLKKFESAGITVSVIGLGKDSDVDAALLKDISKLGQGNIMFTEDAQELPRLFTEDTMSVARSSFIEKSDTEPNGFTSRQVPDSRLFGDFKGTEFPNVDGFNLSYLKPEATMAIVTTDEYAAPLCAGWYRGLGRVTAMSVEVDGQYSGQFGSWNNYGSFLSTHVRWLMGKQNAPDFYLKVTAQGQDAVATIELDPERKNRESTTPPEFMVIAPSDERHDPIKPEFVWTGPDTLQARFKLDKSGTYRTLVKSGTNELYRGPVVSLPYSPEFAPRIGIPSGDEALKDIAQLTGGEERPDVASIFKDPPRSIVRMTLYPYLLGLTMFLLVIEIAGRRLSLWEAVREKIPSTSTGKTSGTWLQRVTRLLPRLPQRRTKSATTTAASATPTTPTQAPTPAKSASKPPEPEVSKEDVYAAAKRRAQNRNK